MGGDCGFDGSDEYESCVKNKTICEAEGDCHGTQLRRRRHVPKLTSDGKLYRNEHNHVEWHEIEPSHMCIVGKVSGENECYTIEDNGKRRENKPDSDVCDGGRDPT